MSEKENGKEKNRREWVKTAAIVFLSVLLVLTFFSNTIMNYSLPEVAAQYVQSGTITAKIRGSGVVESGDPYNVMVKQTRKVSGVAVKVGDEVAKGDVLLYLEDEDSEELKAAQKELEEAQRAYDEALLSEGVTSEIISGANSNTSTASYRQQITAAQNAVQNAQREVDAWQADYNGITADYTSNPRNRINLEDEIERYEDAKEAKGNADFALTEAQNQLTAIENQMTVSGSDLNALTGQKNEAKQKFVNAQTSANNAQLEFDRAKAALDDKISLVKENLDAAQRDLDEKEKTLQKLAGNISGILSLDSYRDAVAEAQKKVDEELEKAVDAVITAEIAGTVTSINAVAGKETSAATPVVVLQPEGKGYTMSFSVTNDQAKRLSVGDKADLVNSWRYDDVEVTLANIKPDTADPGQKKLLTFDVTGGVTAGQSLNVSVGQRSANYDLIVPNSAIREDNNGKFVLIVQSKSSPLGNRYVASRVDIEVLASDDTQSAVSGALYGYEFVITTSTKPVEAGKLIRLANDN